jgi:hypothetical protein
LTPWSPECSVVVPLKDESESLPELVNRITATLRAEGRRFEVILVDDGSTDDSWSVLCALCGDHPELRGMRLRRNFGKATALGVGFSVARGQTVITMDADLQDDPDELPRFLAAVADGADVVSGWKVKRLDPLGKRLPSKVFNAVVRHVSNVDLHDFNCGYKAYSASAIAALRPYVYGEMHRFLPVLAAAQGYRVGELAVRHHPRRHGRSKYGVRRMLSGACDLLTVMLISRFRERPLHVFGTFAALALFAALAITTGLVATGADGAALAVLAAGLTIGVGSVGAGLVCELVVHGFGPLEVQSRLTEAVRGVPHEPGTAEFVPAGGPASAAAASSSFRAPNGLLRSGAGVGVVAASAGDHPA